MGSVLPTGIHRFRSRVSALIKGVLRRQADALLPSRETREYRKWMAQHLAHRRLQYNQPLQPGLLSIITAVWNGSPVAYLEALADSIARQNRDGACEWVVLDNGCTDPKLAASLKRLSENRGIKIQRTETNIGIVKGLRICLKQASGRYILPVDSDDLLYPDALSLVTAWIHKANFPAILYTDEDKVVGVRHYQPYLKPDWDPVLFLNSAYIAHLGIVDRAKALALGAYTDQNTEGSPDWDLFLRYILAGHQPVHIPEIVYSWRVHAYSTADDAASKPYVHSSQQAVLQRFLDTQPDPAAFTIEYSPLLKGSAHFHFVHRQKPPTPLPTFLLGTGAHANANPRSGPETIAAFTDASTTSQPFICFCSEDVQIDAFDWTAEALLLFALHPDTVMIGARIRNSNGTITEAGQYFGFGGVCGSPHAGRSVDDPGYGAQIWKQRSVSAVSTQFAVIRVSYLLELLRVTPPQASLAFLGAWAGALALRTGRRIAYSPFLSGVSNLNWQAIIDPSEEQLFREYNRDLIPDTRFYPRYFSLTTPFAFGDPGQTPQETAVKIWQSAKAPRS